MHNQYKYLKSLHHGSASFYDEYQSDKEAKQQKLSLYKTQTVDSQWTMDCRLGIKHGLGVKCGLCWQKLC